MATPVQLHHPQGIVLTLSTLGASWVACELPMRDGTRRAVILPRCEPPDAATRRAFVGTTVGRYANRIALGRIARDGRAWRLHTDADSRHHLHGGPGGFHAREWTLVHADERSARFSIVSPDGDEGYPGELHAQVVYRLTGPTTIEMHATARVDAPCPVALTNHAYFNLDAAVGDVRDHRLQIASSQFMPIDAELIPTGAPLGVDGTGFDFRAPATLASRWERDAQQRLAGGYDHAYLLDAACAGLARPAAALSSADGSLSLRVSTTLPALQLYGGQFLRGVPRPDGGSWPACAGVALEPGFLPDSPNHPEWPQPSCWLEPGQTYDHVIRYDFVV